MPDSKEYRAGMLKYLKSYCPKINWDGTSWEDRKHFTLELVNQIIQDNPPPDYINDDYAKPGSFCEDCYEPKMLSVNCGRKI